MQTYAVLRDFPQNGKVYRKGSTIDLTERQARHLRISGFIKLMAKPVEKKSPATKKQDKGDK